MKKTRGFTYTLPPSGWIRLSLYIPKTPFSRPTYRGALPRHPSVVLVSPSRRAISGVSTLVNFAAFVGGWRVPRLAKACCFLNVCGFHFACLGISFSTTWYHQINRSELRIFSTQTQRALSSIDAIPHYTPSKPGLRSPVTHLPTRNVFRVPYM